MTEVEIYTSPTCPYCWRAKRLLDAKGVGYTEIDVSSNVELRRTMSERAGGRRTVPQIFIGGRSIGGSDDLAELERSGRLDAILEAA